MGIYAPAQLRERTKFFSDITSTIQASKAKPDIMAGDFNTVTRVVDRESSSKKHQNLDDSFPNLWELVSTLQMKDSNTILNKGFIPTHSMPTAKGLSKSRIDQIYLKIEKIPSLKTTETVPTSSDHSLVTIEIKVKGLPSTKPRWRINETELPVVKALIKKKIKASNINLTEWTKIKMEVGQLIKSSRIKQAKKKTSVFNKLCRKLQKQLNKPLTEERISKITSLRVAISSTIQTMSDTQLRRAKIRLRIIDHQQGKEFYRQLKKPQVNIPISRLRKDDNTLTETEKETFQEGLKFNQKLFDKEKTNPIRTNEVLQCLKKEYNNKQYTKEENELLRKPITTEEIRRNLKQMGKNKSPGPDGFPIEVYKGEDDTIETLRLIFNEILLTKVTNKEFIKGQIILLYKKNDPKELKNYRPISLLDSDYKLFTKILSSRLSQIMSTKINKDQHAFLKGRNIEDNIMEIQLLIELSKRFKLPGYLVFLDQEKAYDRVDHGFLFKVLETMGMDKENIDIIKSLYEDAESSLIINGAIAGNIHCKRGIRQGDALSCILYICTMEALHAYIKHDKTILPIHKEEDMLKYMITIPKTKIYVDDTVACVKTKQCIANLTNRLQLYQEASNAKNNTEKTEIIPIGPNANLTHPDTLLQMKILKKGQPARHLGCPVGNDLKQKDIERILTDKIIKSLNDYNFKYKPARQKATIMRSMITSKLWYTTNFIPISVKQIKTWQSMIQASIWCNNGMRVGKDICTQQLKNGGLNSPDINSIIKIQHIKWIERYHNCEKQQWVKYLKLLMQTKSTTKTPKIFIQNTFIQVVSTQGRLPTYWREISKTWSKLNGSIDMKSDTLAFPQNLNQLPIIFDKSTIPKNKNFTDGLKILNNKDHTIIKYLTTSKRKWKEIELPPEDKITFKRHWIEMDTPLVGNSSKKLKLSNEEYTLKWSYDQFQSKIQRSISNIQENNLPPMVLTIPNFSTCLHVNINGKQIKLEGSNHLRTIYREITKKEIIKPVKLGKTKLNTLQQVSKLLYDHVKTPKLSQFIWRYVIDRVPTKNRYGKGKPDNENLCACKQEVETKEHLFSKCTLAVQAWKQTMNMWNQINELKHNHNLDHKQIMNCFFIKKNKQRLWTILLTATLHSIWTTRNKHIFHNPQNKNLYTPSEYKIHFNTTLKNLLEIHLNDIKLDHNNGTECYCM